MEDRVKDCKKAFQRYTQSPTVETVEQYACSCLLLAAYLFHKNGTSVYNPHDMVNETRDFLRFHGLHMGISHAMNMSTVIMENPDPLDPLCQQWIDEVNTIFEANQAFGNSSISMLKRWERVKALRRICIALNTKK